MTSPSTSTGSSLSSLTIKAEPWVEKPSRRRDTVLRFVSLVAVVMIGKPPSSSHYATGWMVTTTVQPAMTSARRYRNTFGMDYDEPAQLPTDARAFRSCTSSASSSNLEYQRKLIQQKQQQRQQRENNECTVRMAEKSHGMPWKRSIDPTYTSATFSNDQNNNNNNSKDGQLPFMPFWEAQLSFMKENLTNLRAIPVESASGRDLSYMEGKPNKKKNNMIRVHTLLFESDEYRRIRITVWDAGKESQIFTSLCYPHAHSDLPILGVNMMQFGQTKHICAVDFQPLYNQDDDERLLDASRYDHLLAPIRNQYPSLQNALNPRVYDGNQFFSSKTLLGRFDVPLANNDDDQDNGNDTNTKKDLRSMMFEDLLPAFKAYMETHAELIRSTPSNHSDQFRRGVMERQRNFEAFFEARDPAHAALAKHFGEDIANDFLFDVHFPLLEKR